MQSYAAQPLQPDNAMNEALLTATVVSFAQTFSGFVA